MILNSVKAEVVGLIPPIWFALVSVNQRLPSEPRVIAVAPLLAVGIRNSVIAPVVESISPIWFALGLGKPEVVAGCTGPLVIPVGPLLAVGIGKLGDRTRSSG